MGILKADRTVVNLDALADIKTVNANGFGPETTRNPDLIPAYTMAQEGMAWNRGYFSRDLRNAAAPNLGRSPALPMGNGTVPGVTLGSNSPKGRMNV